MDKRITPDLPREITPEHSIADRCRIWADWLDAGIVNGEVEFEGCIKWLPSTYPDSLPIKGGNYRINPALLEPDKPRTAVTREWENREPFLAIELTPEVRAALKAAGIEVEE